MPTGSSPARAAAGSTARKLWFTGACNDELGALVELYGVDEEHTSDDAKRLMRMALDTSDRDELMAKVLDWYEKRGIRGE